MQGPALFWCGWHAWPMRRVWHVIKNAIAEKERGAIPILCVLVGLEGQATGVGTPQVEGSGEVPESGAPVRCTFCSCTRPVVIPVENPALLRAVPVPCQYPSCPCLLQ